METDRFNNPRYINWVKVSLSLNYVKDGIQDFVDSQGDAFHKKVECGVQNRNPSAVGGSGPLCTNCHHKHIKKVRNQKWALSCPNNICSTWMSELLLFSDQQPCPKMEWGNTNPHLWPSHPWEVIKCFQPYGCYNQKSARDSDCTALLTLFTDCKYFQNIVSDVKVARKVKEVRNKTMHSASQEIDDYDLTVFVDALFDFLEDPVELKHLAACQNAVDNIKQLRDGVLNISLLKQVEQPILQQQSNGLASEIEHLRIQVSELRGEITETSESEQQNENNITELQDKLKTIEDVKNRVDKLERRESICSYASQEDMQGVMKAVDELNSSMELQVQGIELLNESLKTQWLCEGLGRKLESQISSCRQYLIEHYDDEYTEIPVYPLVPDETLLLDDIYVQPLVTLKSTNNDNERILIGACDTAIAPFSYRDILSESTGEIRKFTRNIYIIGDAGSGKTTLCQKMVRTWCKAHSESDPKTDDEAYLLQFDLLFFIPLRYFSSHEKVETMIDEVMERDMTEILKESRCLIILDGLDEWEAPDGYKQSPYVSYGLPNRVRSNQYTILTTTRSWKLEVIRPKKQEINIQVDIFGFETDTALELARKLIYVLNNRKGETKSVEHFLNCVKEKKMEHLMSTPINVIQLICLWHDEKPFGNSQCAIYANMIDRQLQSAESLKELPKYTLNVVKKLPNCFEDAKYCQRYVNILTALGELAYRGLFSENQESALVFSHSEVTLCGMSKKDIETCLKVGLLSQTKVFWKVSERSKRVSFIHRSHQDFLAALFISDNQYNTMNIEEIRSMCTTVDKLIETSNFLLFVCGMNASVGIWLLEKILDMSSQDQRIVEYRQSCEKLGNFETVVEIQDMVVNIAEELSMNGLECVRLPVNDLVLNKKSLTCQSIKTEVVKSLYLDSVVVHGKHLQFLKAILQQLKYGAGLQKLCICGQQDFIDVNDLQLLVLFSHKTLKSLRLENVDFSQLLPMLFAQMFVNVQMTAVVQLTSLAVVNLTLTAEQDFMLLKYLSQMPNIQILSVINKVLPKHTNPDLGTRILDLSRNKGMQKLVIRNMSIGKIILQPAVLCDCTIDSSIPDVVKSAFHCLHDAINMRNLFVRICRHPNVVQAMIQCMPRLVNIQRLRLCRVDLSSKSLLLSPDMIGLEHFSLEYAVFSSKSFEDMIDSFPSHDFCLELDSVVVKTDCDFISAKEYLHRNEKIRCKTVGLTIVLKSGNVSCIYRSADALKPQDTTVSHSTYRFSDNYG